MPTTLTSSTTPAWKVDLYVEAVRSEAYRALLKSHGRFDADDIASEVVLKLLGRVEFFMERYANPLVFARAVCRTTAVDFTRRDNAQRCAGARNERPNVYGDKPSADTGLSFFDVHVDRDTDIADEVVQYLDEQYLWAELALGIPERQLEIMRLTIVEGFTDAEVGRKFGKTREYVNRGKNGGLHTARELLT